MPRSDGCVKALQPLGSSGRHDHFDSVSDSDSLMLRLSKRSQLISFFLRYNVPIVFPSDRLSDGMEVHVDKP